MSLRVVEKRRGELLGEPQEGRPKKNSPRAGTFSVPSQTASTYRTLARWWDRLLWPIVREADCYAKLAGLGWTQQRIAEACQPALDR